MRERWEIFEGSVFGQQAVGSIRARNRGERLRDIVVNGVPSDSGGVNGEGRGKESDDGDELHVCDCKGAKAVFIGVSGTTTSLSIYSFWVVTLGVKRRGEMRGHRSEPANMVKAHTWPRSSQQKELLRNHGVSGEAGVEATQSSSIVCIGMVAS